LCGWRVRHDLTLCASGFKKSDMSERSVFRVVRGSLEPADVRPRMPGDRRIERAFCSESSESLLSISVTALQEAVGCFVRAAGADRIRDGNEKILDLAGGFC
jgi:hypothetical protein